MYAYFNVHCAYPAQRVFFEGVLFAYRAYDYVQCNAEHVEPHHGVQSYKMEYHKKREVHECPGESCRHVFQRLVYLQ